MENSVTVSEIKRRGMAVIEEGLQRGPLHIIKHNQPAAVVLTETEYEYLVSRQPRTPGLSALEWLLALPLTGTRSQADIDAELAQERDW